MPVTRAPAAAPGAVQSKPHPFGGLVLLEPAGDLVRAEDGRVDLEHPAAALGGDRVAPAASAAALAAPGRPSGNVCVQAVAQHAELEGVEELVDRLAAPRRGGEVARGRADDLRRQVADERGQLAVAQHVAEVLAQRVARLALDLVDPVDEVFQRPVLDDPLRRGLLADAGDGRQVVARVAAQRGEVRVLGRGQAVLLLQARGVVALHVGDAAAVVQDGRLVRDELERVPVAGDDQDVAAFRLRLGGQGGDDVVGLVAGGGQVPDAERVEYLEDQADLAAELVGGLGAARPCTRRTARGGRSARCGRRRRPPGSASRRAAR